MKGRAGNLKGYLPLFLGHSLKLKKSLYNETHLYRMAHF